LAGTTFLTGSHPNPTLGEHLILVGLFTQIAAFGVFIIVAFLFHKRLHAHPTSTSMTMERLWKKHMYALYFVSFMILIRSIVRVVEYLQGSGGYIMSHEAFLYIFDATLMLVAVVTFNVVHPSEIIPGKGMSNEMR
jgi:tellurite resistance protein TehA-like permease